MTKKLKTNIQKTKNEIIENERTITKKKSSVTKSKVAVSSGNTSCLEALPSITITQIHSKVKNKGAKKKKLHEELLKDLNDEEHLNENIIQTKSNAQNNDLDSNKGTDTT